MQSKEILQYNAFLLETANISLDHAIIMVWDDSSYWSYYGIDPSCIARNSNIVYIINPGSSRGGLNAKKSINSNTSSNSYLKPEIKSK